MRRHRSARLPEEPLWPTYTPVGEDPARRAAAMRELRSLSNEIADAFAMRDQRMLALASSQSLSRRDMAIACGLNKSRVDQIIVELAKADQERRNAAAHARSGRHAPISAA